MGTEHRGRRWPWVAGVAILALLLGVQVVHAERERIVRNASFGPVLAGAYDFLGLSVLAPTDLSAYELRQWGAASDPRDANRLMLRASIVNRAGYAQPLPLLRLTLQDRFGGTLGPRDVGPADYLPGSGTPTLLEPGQRADALIRIVDPGSEAVGFELDICLPADGGDPLRKPDQDRAPMKIGPFELAAPLALAPMAGVTDLPFRQLCRRMGAGSPHPRW